MCRTDNTELIVQIIKQSAAYKAGGIDYVRKRKSVLIFNPHGKCFLAISILSALSIFKVVIKYSKNNNSVYLKVK